MTVADLIEQLRKLPPELPVLVEGYETGWDAIYDIRTSYLIRNAQANDWDGEYEEPGKAEPKPGLPHQAALIVGRRGHRRESLKPLHALYTLVDYPVLAALAAERTQATRLDGRACRAIYENARQRIDWQAMPTHERDFAQRLGVVP
ncbi:hypothetical protein [Thauera chlorobenzoica]|uniref:hypothetical protein n=1 Tax=Thauera chlorobenzoica TaxID=96773 RepID=UPI0018DC7A53|nr:MULTISPECIES: hypothetical protein [Thauera]MCK2127264.1 hypothetical protein [Thauera aromatica]